MIAYLSGPMTGIADQNYPAFHAAAAALQKRGINVLSPASFGQDENFVWADYLRRDIRLLMEADHIILLDGHQSSTGSILELHIARELGMRVGYYITSDGSVSWEK